MVDKNISIYILNNRAVTALPSVKEETDGKGGGGGTTTKITELWNGN